MSKLGGLLTSGNEETAEGYLLGSSVKHEYLTVGENSKRPFYHILKKTAKEI